MGIEKEVDILEVKKTPQQKWSGISMELTIQSNQIYIDKISAWIGSICQCQLGAESQDATMWICDSLKDFLSSNKEHTLLPTLQTIQVQNQEEIFRTTTHHT